MFFNVVSIMFFSFLIIYKEKIDNNKGIVIFEWIYFLILNLDYSYLFIINSNFMYTILISTVLKFNETIENRA